MQKRILLTGGSGFIGSYLLKRLIESNYYIITITRKPLEIISENYKNIIYDGTYESLNLKIKNEQIDFVIHLATYFLQNHKPPQIEELISSNITFGNHLLELTKELKISVFINTITYAQSVNGIKYDPQNLYSATKEAFEKIIKFYELTCPNTKFITLELFDTYGPGDTRPKFLNLLINSIKKGEDFNMSEGNQEISYQYIDDVTDAYITCLNNISDHKIRTGSRYSIYNGEVFKLKDLADLANNLTGNKIEITKGFYPYKNREIMKIKANYDILPFWTPKVKLADGILKIFSNE